MRFVFCLKSFSPALVVAAGLVVGLGGFVSTPALAAPSNSFSLKSCGSYGQQGELRVFGGTPARLGFCCDSAVQRGNFSAPILAVSTPRGDYFVRPVACYKS